MKLLILGSKGQLGSSILETIAKNSSEKIELKSRSREELDITKAEEVEREFEIFQPDTVVNCAAWTNVASADTDFTSARKINFNGVVNIARYAEKQNSRVIQISTDYVFNGRLNSPIDERETQNPINRYGETKAEAEKFLLSEYKENSIIVRTAWLYGPYGKNFARTIFRKALKAPKEKIKVVDDQIGQPTSSLDLASKILEIVDSDIRSGVYHGTNSGMTSWFGFAKLLLESAGISSERLTPILSSDFQSEVQRPKYSVLGHEGWGTIGFSAMRSWDSSVRESALRIRKVEEHTDGI